MNVVRDYTGFLLKDAITTIACALLMASVLSACNDSTNSGASGPTTAPTNAPVAESFSLNSILNSIEGARSGVQDAVGPHADAIQNRTREEVEKLFRWEYRVSEVPMDIAPAELESQLRELGTQGWECFDLDHRPNSVTRITCKRRPKSAISYLKYLPGL
jgi:hypothetical protein